MLWIVCYNCFGVIALRKVDKIAFHVEFLNEVYKACDALSVSVPDEVDSANTIEGMLAVAEKIGCKLSPVLTSSRVQEINIRETSNDSIEKIETFFEKLPSFRMKVIPDPGENAFRYTLSADNCLFEALYFPEVEICLIARFTYRDLQMFKAIGDRDTDTRVALGKKARQCVDLLLG